MDKTALTLIIQHLKQQPEQFLNYCQTQRYTRVQGLAMIKQLKDTINQPKKWEPKP